MRVRHREAVLVARNCWGALQGYQALISVMNFAGPWRWRHPRSRTNRRLRRRGVIAGCGRRLRTDGALQISQFMEGRGTIGLLAVDVKLASDGTLIVCLLYRGKLFAVGDGGL